MAWTWVNSSVRGTSHARTGVRCQDASTCQLLRQGDVLVVAVSDGAGSTRFGGEGAALTCRTLSQRARAHFKTTAAFPTDDDLWSWVNAIRDRIATAAKKRNATSREFSATLVGGLIGANEAMIFHIGDGAIALRIGDDWQVPSWPESGEYAATTYFVTDDPSPRLRITRVQAQVNGLVAFSDGVERLALNFAGQTPHLPFFKGIFLPLEKATATGRDRPLARKLASYLDSPAVNQRTDDDKTLVLARRL